VANISSVESTMPTEKVRFSSLAIVFLPKLIATFLSHSRSAGGVPALQKRAFPPILVDGSATVRPAAAAAPVRFRTPLFGCGRGTDALARKLIVAPRHL
jgi:hypothetical protein